MANENDMLGQTAAVYLRKSRMEEGLDTDEVLRKHRHGLDIVDFYPEGVYAVDTNSQAFADLKKECEGLL